jgi:hypothetical protein
MKAVILNELLLAKEWVWGVEPISSKASLPCYIYENNKHSSVRTEPVCVFTSPGLIQTLPSKPT